MESLANIGLNVTEIEQANCHKVLSWPAKILIATTGGISIGLTVIGASFIAPAFRRICLPYVPATDVQIRNVMNCLPINAKGRLLDIGSGDGRIVIAAARHCKGLHTEGVELNPWLVWYSRLAAIRYGVGGQTTFKRLDLWKLNLKPYDYVVIFGVQQMMLDLLKKLLNENPNTKVIACRFPLPNIVPTMTIDSGVNTVWMYNLSCIVSK